MIDRRSFLYQSVLASAALGLLACDNATAPASPPEEAVAPNDPVGKLPYLDTIGIQLYTVRNQMAEDPRATLAALADIGYRQVELMDTRDITTLKPLCDDLGLKVNSSFMQWTTLTGRWDLVPAEEKPFTFEEVLEQTVAGALSHLVFGYLTPGERRTADDWKRRAEELNLAGEKAQQAGVQMAYHNHNFEWAAVEGTNGFDLLTERMDGQLVPFELDVAWVAMAGQDPGKVLRSVRDRVELLHIKNLKPLDAAYTTIESMPDESFIELGAGKLDVATLMKMGRKFGVEYCFYEQDNNWHPDALGSARASLEYLTS